MRTLQAGLPVLSTEAAHCSRSVDRCWGKGLQNTAEDIAEPETAEGTGLQVGPGLPVALEDTVVPERIVVAAGMDREPVGTGRNTGADPLLGPWDLLVQCCSRLIDSRVHRHLGRIQHTSDSLRTKGLMIIN